MSKKRREPRGIKAYNEMLGIDPRYAVTKFCLRDGYHVAYLHLVEHDRTCPHCGGKGWVKGRYRRKVWHTPVRCVPLMLLIEQVRFTCTACNKTWSEKQPILGEASIHMSKDVEDACLIDLMDKMSLRAVSAKEGPSACMVARVLDAAMVDNAYLPRVLCIDEFKANTDRGRMSVAISDGDAGVLIEVLPELSSRCLAEFFSRFTEAERRGVRYFCCDMASTFIAAQARWFPEAKLCIDRFHVVHLITHAFSCVRRRIQQDEELPADIRHQMKGARLSFLKRRSELEQADIDYATKLANRRLAIASALDLTEDDIYGLEMLRPREPRCTLVDRLCEASWDLHHAYELLQLFYEWSDMAWCAEKRDSLSKWISLALRSGIPEMKRAARTLQRLREGILNGYRYDKTNATAEGLNNSIKAMKRMSYGFSSFARMRRRCLLALGFYRICARNLKLKEVEE